MKDCETPPIPAHFSLENGKIVAGRHMIVDLMGASGLDDEAKVRRALSSAATACGATLLHLHTHRFSPQGITGVALLAESHITVHTWPEIGYAAFDIFLCGASRPEPALPIFSRVFETDDIQVRLLTRGENLCRSHPDGKVRIDLL